MKQIINCRECEFFERGKWHQLLGGGDQLGGTCPLLLSILKINNQLTFTASLYIPESFGCVMGREKVVFK